MLVTVGIFLYVNWSAVEVTLVPPGVVTVTSTPPAELEAGEVAVIVVSEFTVNTEGTPPNVTAVAPVNPVPVMVTEGPPTSGPCVGETSVTVGDCTNDVTVIVWGADVVVPAGFPAVSVAL
jgi:hypothetical protein